MSDDRLNWVISVDDHALEPPDLWQTRLPAKFRDTGPRLVRQGGGDAWAFEDRSFPLTGLVASAGQTKEEFTAAPTTYDAMRKGCYDPVARVKDMDAGGVIAALNYPSFPWFTGLVFTEMKDKALAKVCVQALNDWHIDEWCASAPGRFIPGMTLPIWDIAECVAEIERCAAKGSKTIFFPMNPSRMDLPSIHNQDGYWDPVFAAAQAAQMPLSIHISSSSWNMPKTSEDCPLILSVGVNPLDAAYTTADWIFSGNLERFPGIKLCLAEGGIGWIPFLLERLNYVVDRHGAWASESDFDMDLETGKLEARVGGRTQGLDKLPSEIFHEHFFMAFIDDKYGTSNIDSISVGNVVVEVDYPHPDSSWPDSVPVLRDQLSHLSEEETYRIFQGNAIDIFNFTPAPYPA